MELNTILEAFGIEGSTEIIAQGHIHRSYRVLDSETKLARFLLQRINHHVFPDIELLQSNLSRLLDHLHRQHVKEEAADWVPLRLHRTLNGQTYWRDEHGYFWRIFGYLQDFLAYDRPPTLAHVQRGGRAFGQFLQLISSLPLEQFSETIPDFHSLSFRKQQLESALAHHPPQSKVELEAVQLAQSFLPKLWPIEQARQKGTLPLRLTHNDTKFNNVLFSTSHLQHCIIDLDTVMPGLIHYDLGDALRTLAATCAEDEADLGKIGVNTLYIENFTTHFLDCIQSLSTEEIDSLPISPALLSGIMGIRFLTDHLQGDQYYQVQFRGHNLQRARCQLQLMRLFWEAQDVIEKCVFNASHKR